MSYKNSTWGITRLGHLDSLHFLIGNSCVSHSSATKTLTMKSPLILSYNRQTSSKVQLFLHKTLWSRRPLRLLIRCLITADTMNLLAARRWKLHKTTREITKSAKCKCIQSRENLLKMLDSTCPHRTLVIKPWMPGLPFKDLPILKGKCTPLVETDKYLSNGVQEHILKEDTCGDRPWKADSTSWSFWNIRVIL